MLLLLVDLRSIAPPRVELVLWFCVRNDGQTTGLHLITFFCPSRIKPAGGGSGRRVEDHSREIIRIVKDRQFTFR